MITAEEFYRIEKERKKAHEAMAETMAVEFFKLNLDIATSSESLLFLNIYMHAIPLIIITKGEYSFVC